MRWFEATIVGRSHTGTTPMDRQERAARRRLVERIDAIAHAYPPHAVGTVGLIEVKPNSRNVVPGRCSSPSTCAIPDGRARHDGASRHAAAREVCDPLGLAGTVTNIWDEPPTRFDPGCIAAVRRAAETSGYSFRDMVSGAGHDSVYVARVAPTAMIFVPCRDGISHNEAEFSSKEQCAAGAQVLLQAVLDYDRQLAERSRGA